MNVKVKLTGVGFFDFIHGQKGIAANGREIHPVLSMEYKKNKDKSINIEILYNHLRINYGEFNAIRRLQ